MARSAAIGQDAFVNTKTGVASYYWRSMDAGSGPFPHHAWWQIGWITDYLMAEAELRSGGRVVFPRGFITPKVGPHQSYGFAPGTAFGKKANLRIIVDGVNISNPSLEHIVAESEDKSTVHILLLNQHHENQTGTVKLDLQRFKRKNQPTSVRILDHEGKITQSVTPSEELKVSVPSYGLAALELVFE